MEPDLFDDRARQVLDAAQQEARRRRQVFVGPEHLLLALISERDGFTLSVLARMQVTVEAARTALDRAAGHGRASRAGRLPFTSRCEEVLHCALDEARRAVRDRAGPEHVLLGIVRDQQNAAAQVLTGLGCPGLHTLRTMAAPSAGAITVQVSSGSGLEAALDAAFGPAIPRVCGRQREIQRVARTLSRQHRNNPVLIGEPGVGRKSVVAGFAEALAAGQVTPVLRDRRVHRLTGQETAGIPPRSILYVDDLRDAGAHLVNAITSGRWQVLSIATPESFAALDPALARWLQPIPVAEMDEATALEVLHGLRDRMQSHHGLSITDGALAQVVHSARLRVTTSPLPGSAIDLLDEVCARSHPLGAAPDGPVTVTETTVTGVLDDVLAESYLPPPRTTTRTSAVPDPFARSDADVWMIS
ncbi:Clp protease N-terminal domain-containing protein [Lentzea sp. HUAS12]|uniref:Clp protease N-terminal domain-containing protein n=1 Tax=Lentzea sp. HUAS12 TaxID=2951806 RepID=UPI0020A2298A|nr:Clp protease N-terminal domain-containing protein [Lentzea sp. HUAS12]USX54181.1 hypothetical protein ND450_08800 [Lentzea sp. HUAS12]